MEILNIGNKSHIHFIGIGGISMSSLAMILNYNGYTVTGSDSTPTHITKKLEEKGINVFIGHDEKNVGDANLVVYTAAIKKTNPEYIYAEQNGIKIVERSVFLGALMKAYKYPCCISGTHGKTTTTSMVALIMQNSKLDPTALVGGEVKELDGNLRIGRSDVFVTEACEYVESFLDFFPFRAAILNVEADHLDYFRDIDHIISAFGKFASLIPENGQLIVNGADKNAMKAAKNAKCEIITFGITGEYTCNAKNIVFDNNGFASYDLYYNNEFVIHITLGVPGKHNILNSLAAAAVCLSYGCSEKVIAETLADFHGTHRRFEIKGTVNGITVVDDYAHHPTEIKAALDTARNYCNSKITAVFQSHTYTRTKALLNDFSEAFYNADKIIVTDIYAAREKDTGLIKPQDLVDLLIKNGKDAIYIGPFEDIVKYLKENTHSGEMVITIGAGTVFKSGEMFINS